MTEIPGGAPSKPPASSRAFEFDRKPPNTGYHISAVPGRYQDQVQLHAVLMPRFKLKTKADIIRATAWMLYLWRNRADALAKADYVPFAPAKTGIRQRRANAMNCPVAFVMTYEKKQGRHKPCNMRTICPFCWAREVRKQWLKIDAAFFPVPPAPPLSPKNRRIRVVDTDHTSSKSLPFTRSVKGDENSVKRVKRVSTYDLVQRVQTFHLPAESEVEAKPGISGSYSMHGLRAWLESRIKGQPYPKLHRLPVCRRLLEAAGPGSGMIETIRFRRLDNSDLPWEVQIRQLIMAVDGHKIPAAKMGIEPFHRIVPKPKRWTVVRAVAKTLHYPNWLLDKKTELKDVMEYLTVRRDLRLVETYGSFRNQSD